MISMILWDPVSTAAQTLSAATYNKPVSVSIVSGPTITFSIEGIYELRNKSTNERTYLNPGISLTSTRNGQNVVLSSHGQSYTSVNGFTLQEVVGPAKVSTFSRETQMRKGAQANYAVVTSFYPGEAVIYLSSFVNGQGETWFNVMDSKGQKGWVPAQTTFAPKDTPTLSLTSVNSNKYRGSMEINPSSSTVSLINRLNIENYLKGVVAAEMPASWHMEALKAQAISARSFALNSMSLSNTTSSQVYKGFTREHPDTNEAVEKTSGKIVTYNGKPIQTFFYSASGGRTANIGDVWNSNQANFPYLVSVDDPFENSANSNWSESFPSKMLLNSFGFNSSDTLHDIQLSKTGANGEVRAITLMTSAGDKTISGNELQIRQLIPVSGQGYTFLRSNWFDIVYPFTVKTASADQQQFSITGQRVQTATTITTVPDSTVQVQTTNGTTSLEALPTSVQLNGKGFGHRIGMSQHGAKGLAENGRTAEQIITHYYPGTKIETY